jgi:hypothetical protein
MAIFGCLKYGVRLCLELLFSHCITINYPAYLGHNVLDMKKIIIMKKNLITLWSLLVLAIPAAAQAQYGHFTNSDGSVYTYNTNADGSANIAGYAGPPWAVTVPTSINGQMVTSIGENAFEEEQRMTSVTIPGNVASIGETAFYSCTNLTNVSLGAGVASIGIDSFAFCLSLPSIVIPDSLTNGGSFAFEGCIALTNIVIGKGLTKLEAMFAGCISLGSVTVPATVTRIGGAFEGCSTLTNITIPPSFTNIQGAFEGCTGLTNFVIASFVTDIGPYAFADCSNLRTILIPEGVNYIDSYAFNSCTNLGSITIPASVTEIAGGSGIGNSIEGQPFAGCTSLTNVTILGSPTIDEYAFYENSLTSVYIAGGSIGEYAFEICTNLTDVTLGEGVTSIAASAFLTDPVSEIRIPGSVTNIGSDAFDGCSLATATFSSGVTTIAGGAFVGNPLTSIYLPATISNVGDQAFYGCGSLTNVIIAAGVSSISAAAFEECGRLTNVLFLGNAPAVVGLPGDGPVFEYSPHVTVYYLPGTTGWSNTFGWNQAGGAPTALWNPLIQNNGRAFGLSNNQFGFNITGTANIPIVVEACTNLASPVWTAVTNVLLTNGSFHFSDPQWTNYPARFYGIGFP